MIDVCSLDMSVKPLVSIWCLTYNFAPFIRQAMEGFLAQETDFPYEILIHDDFSTDDTVAVLREYQQKYPDKIRLLLEEANQGTKHLHRFLDKVRGDYVAICEGDDYWTDPHKLQKQLGFLREHPEYAMAFTACDIEENGVIVDAREPYKKVKTVSAGTVIVVGGFLCPSASLVIKKEHLYTLPDYYFQADTADYPMQIHMASCGKVYYLPDHTCVYRRGRAGSWSTNVKASQERYLAHYKNEVAWLNAVNTATNGRYRLALTVRKVIYRMGPIRNWYRLHKSSK